MLLTSLFETKQKQSLLIGWITRERLQPMLLSITLWKVWSVRLLTMIDQAAFVLRNALFVGVSFETL